MLTDKMQTDLESLRTPGTVLQGMLYAFWYNRDEKHMLALAQEIKNRIDGKFGGWTEDGNIVFGTLVCLYGDYGTSPRSGWIESKAVKEACYITLDDFIEEVNTLL